MNSWENILNLLGYCVLALLVVAIGLAAYVLIMVLIGLFRDMLRRKAKKPDPTLVQYMSEATLIGRDLYPTNTMVDRDDLLEAYRQGARWGWAFFHRKG